MDITKEEKICYLINFIKKNLKKVNIVKKIEEFESDLSESESEDQYEEIDSE